MPLKLEDIEAGEKEYPMKSFLDAGVLLAGASDYPVQVPSPPPLGITRCMPGETDSAEVLGPEQRMSLADMLAAFTMNGADANFLETEAGSRVHKGVFNRVEVHPITGQLSSEFSWRMLPDLLLRELRDR